jgi:outer membrane murein-binding lipoprotein Lpp
VAWTDDKIDGLAEKVDTLSTQVSVLDTKVDEGFEAVNQQLGDLRAGQAQLVDRFDAMQRTLVQVGFSLVVGLIGALVAVLVVVLTH